MERHDVLEFMPHATNIFVVYETKKGKYRKLDGRREKKGEIYFL